MQRLPIYMGDTPTYKIKGDHMHIIWRELEIVLAVSTMLAGMASASEEIAKWQVARLDSDSVVVQFSERR